MGGDNLGGMMFGTAVFSPRERRRGCRQTGWTSCVSSRGALTAPRRYEYLEARTAPLPPIGNVLRQKTGCPSARRRRSARASRPRGELKRACGREESNLVSRDSQGPGHGRNIDAPATSRCTGLGTAALLESGVRKLTVQQGLNRVYPHGATALTAQSDGAGAVAVRREAPADLPRVRQPHLADALRPRARRHGRRLRFAGVHSDASGAAGLAGGTGFVESGPNLKQLHKMIVMSATYRQSSEATDALLQRDPTNLLLARYTRRRIAAEVRATRRWPW